MIDYATIDVAGLVLALFAILGAAGNYIKINGRAKYLTAITEILDVMMDTVLWGQALMKVINGETVDQPAFQAKGKEILDHITKIKTDLGL
jgi:hypothetical protein